jgi:hypothetical protein
MSWEALSAVGQIVGAAAVVISLAYLAIQVRQNTRSARAASFHAVTDSFNQLNSLLAHELNSLLAHDESLARIFQVGLQNLKQLDPVQRIRFEFFVLAASRIFETLFYQSRQGIGEKALWKVEEATMRSLLSNPGIREWWQSNPFRFTPEFRAYVERLIQGKAGYACASDALRAASRVSALPWCARTVAQEHSP